MKTILDLMHSAKGDKSNILLDENQVFLHEDKLAKKDKYTVSIVALGDVGSNILLGLYLLGEDVIETIKIWDIDENVKKRFEIEINQINDEKRTFPNVISVEENEIFDCDIFLFCASASIPKEVTKGMDVRMIQLDKNKMILEKYCNLASKVDYKCIFAIVSDPVDPLCKYAEYKGLDPLQIKGFGLGVMMSRARYFAKQILKDYKAFETEARAFGPHGQDLVIANSIKNYDKTLSEQITDMSIKANLKVRALGFKPFIAPAISSGAISVISYLRGDWHYSSLHFGNIYLGIRNCRKNEKVLVENFKFNEDLFNKIESAIHNLQSIKF